MTVDLTRKITLHQNLLPYFCTVYVISKGDKISSMRHARGKKLGVKRDQSMSVSSSVGSSTTRPPAKPRKIKDRPRVQKVFKKSELNRPVSSAQSRTVGIKPKTSSQMCSTGPSKRNSEQEMLLELCSTATELCALLGEDKITLNQTMHAVDKFRDDHDKRILWLKMSPENKIKYVKDLKVISLSKAPTRRAGPVDQSTDDC